MGSQKMTLSVFNTDIAHLCCDYLVEEPQTCMRFLLSLDNADQSLAAYFDRCVRNNPRIRSDLKARFVAQVLTYSLIRKDLALIERLWASYMPENLPNVPPFYTLAECAHFDLSTEDHFALAKLQKQARLYCLETYTERCAFTYTPTRDVLWDKRALISILENLDDMQFVNQALTNEHLLGIPGHHRMGVVVTIIAAACTGVQRLNLPPSASLQKETDAILALPTRQERANAAFALFAQVPREACLKILAHWGNELLIASILELKLLTPDFIREVVDSGNVKAARQIFDSSECKPLMQQQFGNFLSSLLLTVGACQNAEMMALVIAQLTSLPCSTQLNWGKTPRETGLILSTCTEESFIHLTQFESFKKETRFWLQPVACSIIGQGNVAVAFRILQMPQLNDAFAYWFYSVQDVAMAKMLMDDPRFITIDPIVFEQMLVHHAKNVDIFKILLTHEHLKKLDSRALARIFNAIDSVILLQHFQATTAFADIQPKYVLEKMHGAIRIDVDFAIALSKTPQFKQFEPFTELSKLFVNAVNTNQPKLLAAFTSRFAEICATKLGESIVKCACDGHLEMLQAITAAMATAPTQKISPAFLTEAISAAQNLTDKNKAATIEALLKSLPIENQWGAKK
jgi:hypothetical protein